MTLLELYPQIKTLQHADKLRLMQFLISELAWEEQITLDVSPAKPTQSIDALQAIADMAQPLGDENLAHHFFKDH